MAIQLNQIAEEVIQTDLLVIGGGMAGCTAALSARKKGNVDVAIMEKAAIRYSGETGFDDFNFTGNHAFGDWDY
jgi:2-polyprenyl-6-methoxyphenol hydroxylase-like FAD-dependent oxidoreductase